MTAATQYVEERSWQGRPLAARLIKLTVFAAPILCSIILTRFVVVVLPRPVGWDAKVGWWLLVLTTSVTTGAVVDRWSRRLLPVAALMTLSLVFPDEAPSRFKVALRRDSIRALERRLNDDAIDPTSTPNDSAEILIEMAAQLSRHDRNTRGHTERVRAYALMIGEELGLSASQLNKLHWAAMVHDVGKLRVPADILNKPGKPDEDEWAILKQHPEWGDEMIRPLRPWLGSFADATVQHHEKWDGTGYPRGLKGNQISLSARIVSVADAYDVMTSVRSYKTAMTGDEARNELARCAGSQFDPRCTRALISASLGASAKTKKGIVWAIRAPLLTLTARSNLFSNGATAATADAATAAVVAVTAPPAEMEQPLSFIEPEPAVEVIGLTVTPDQVFVPTVGTAIVDVTVNDRPEGSGFGDRTLYVQLPEDLALPEGLSVEGWGGDPLVLVSDGYSGTESLPLQICVNELSCAESELTVTADEFSASRPVVPVEAIRLDRSTGISRSVVAAAAAGDVAPVGFDLEVGQPEFFTTAPEISDDGQLTFSAGPVPGLTVITVTPLTASGAAEPIYLYVLIE